MALPLPSFIERDPQKIIDEQVAYYEGLIGKPLEPAQIERLLINNFAYRENLIRNQVQAAALQNLVAFATFPILDYLGELVGVTRLPASSAEATVEFTLVSGHGGVVIPAGLRIQSSDGQVVFELLESLTVLAGVDTATGTCAAQVAGARGNAYIVGAINNILDPQPYLSAAANTDISNGGSDEETDVELRDRIRLAPSSFSNAGSKGAYKFWAKSAHPSIIDVGVGSTTPGTVDVYPLSSLGTPTPTAVIDAVEAVLTDERVRPLSDTVVVTSPTVVNYTIDMDLVLLPDTPPSETEQAVNDALQAYTDERAKSLGFDIVRSQISAKGQISGVYSVTLNSPTVDTVLDENEVAVCTGITVTVTGVQDA